MRKSKSQSKSSAPLSATSDVAHTGSWAAAGVIESDKRSSAQPVGSIDLSGLSPKEFIQAIHQLLATGDHRHARRITEQAVGFYPKDVELTKMAHILARPTVVKKKLEPDTSISANQRWLKENFEAYKDKWVALRNGELVESANTAKELKAHINDFTGMMVTKV